MGDRTLAGVTGIRDDDGQPRWRREGGKEQKAKKRLVVGGSLIGGGDGRLKAKMLGTQESMSTVTENTNDRSAHSVMRQWDGVLVQHEV